MEIRRKENLIPIIVKKCNYSIWNY